MQFAALHRRRAQLRAAAAKVRSSLGSEFQALGADEIMRFIRGDEAEMPEGEAPLETLKRAWDGDRMDLLLLLVKRGHGIGFEGPQGFLMDADGQHPVDLLATMLQRWREGVDVVYAVRRTRTDQSSLHVLLTGWFYKLINWGNRVQIPANAGDFRLMDRQVVDALLLLPERNRFMKGLYAWVGFPSESLDYEPLPRVKGQSHFPLGGAFRLALTGTLAFSTVPLRVLTLAGLTLAAVSMAYILVVLYEYFVQGIAVPGYATLVVSIMFFSGIQLLALGVMSEYVGRIYEEVKRRPMYLVRQRSGQGLRRDETAS